MGVGVVGPISFKLKFENTRFEGKIFIVNDPDDLYVVPTNEFKPKK